MNFLEKVRKEKLAEVRHRKKSFPVTRMKIRKASHSFLKALGKKWEMKLIGEFKKSSPSRGSINKSASLAEFMRLYDEYADAISILTEEKHFSGSLDFLKGARRFTKKPLLRKDFIVDAYQIFEARHYGADAILLIANILTEKQIGEFIEVADSLGMDCLVECDSFSGLKKILRTNAKIIGINNRNLATLREDFAVTARLAKKIPKGRRNKIVLVSESAINSRRQVDSLKGIADAILVGTAIMSFPVPRVKLKELSGKTLVKICGITSEKDAMDAVKLGADLIGLNFYPKSPRFVSIGLAKKIAHRVKGKALVAGVFVNEGKNKVRKIAKRVGLDLAQFSGNEKPSEINGIGLPVIKAVHVEDKGSIAKAKSFRADFIMLDAPSKGLFGGTGTQINEKFLQNVKINSTKLIFSGGLNAGNVKRIIKEFNPVIVDVCSATEARPGVKNYAKMREFIQSAVGKK
ncbi:MAG: hypothetical protein AABW99_00925 [archaeon]